MIQKEKIIGRRRFDNVRLVLQPSRRAKIGGEKHILPGRGNIDPDADSLKSGVCYRIIKIHGTPRTEVGGSQKLRASDGADRNIVIVAAGRGNRRFIEISAGCHKGHSGVFPCQGVNRAGFHISGRGIAASPTAVDDIRLPAFDSPEKGPVGSENGSGRYSESADVFAGITGGNRAGPEFRIGSHADSRIGKRASLFGLNKARPRKDVADHCRVKIRSTLGGGIGDILGYGLGNTQFWRQSRPVKNLVAIPDKAALDICDDSPLAEKPRIIKQQGAHRIVGEGLRFKRPVLIIAGDELIPKFIRCSGFPGCRRNKKRQRKKDSEDATGHAANPRKERVRRQGSQGARILPGYYAGSLTNTMR